MTHLLEVRNLVKTFGAIRAVDNVSFTLDAGQTLALVGASGSGKSTLARCLLRLIEPDAGDIRFEGKEVLRLESSSLKQLRRGMQLVFQEPLAALNPRMCVGQAIGEPLLVHHLCSRSERPAQVDRLLHQVGLSADHADRYPHELSGGQRQRVVIARALAVQPKLLIADEPVAALDVSIQAQILNLLRDLQAELGLAYLFITHNLAIARHLAQHTAVMHQGKIVESGTTEELFRAPQHEYTRALLGFS